MEAAVSSIIRTVQKALGIRREDRPDDITFCDQCSEITDSTVRVTSYRREQEAAVAVYGHRI
jgi:hypothetical protein